MGSAIDNLFSGSKTGNNNIQPQSTGSAIDRLFGGPTSVQTKVIDPTQLWNGVQIPAHIPTKNLVDYNPSTNTRTFQLPGGGVYSQDAQNNIVIGGHTTYGGLPTVPGQQRDDIIPVSLGGTNTNPKNIRMVPNSVASEQDKVETAIDRLVKTGQIQPKAAITSALSQKEQIANQPTLLQKVGGFFKNIVTGAKQAATSAPTTSHNPLDILGDAWTRAVGSTVDAVTQVPGALAGMGKSVWEQAYVPPKTNSSADKFNATLQSITNLPQALADTMITKPFLDVGATFAELATNKGVKVTIPPIGLPGLSQNLKGLTAQGATSVYEDALNSGMNDKDAFIASAEKLGLDLSIVVPLAMNIAGGVLRTHSPESLLKSVEISRQQVGDILNDRPVDPKVIDAYKSLNREQRLAVAKGLLSKTPTPEPSILGRAFGLDDKAAQALFDEITKVPEVKPAQLPAGPEVKPAEVPTTSAIDNLTKSEIKPLSPEIPVKPVEVIPQAPKSAPGEAIVPKVDITAQELVKQMGTPEWKQNQIKVLQNQITEVNNNVVKGISTPDEIKSFVNKKNEQIARYQKELSTSPLAQEAQPKPKKSILPVKKETPPESRKTPTPLNLYRETYITSTYKGRPVTTNAFILEVGDVLKKENYGLRKTDKLPEETIAKIIPDNVVKPENKLEIKKFVSSEAVPYFEMTNKSRVTTHLQSGYVNYFLKKFGSDLEFYSKEDNIPTLVQKSNGEFVGLIMPIRKEVSAKLPVSMKPPKRVGLNKVTVPEAPAKPEPVVLSAGINPNVDKFIEEDLKPFTKEFGGGVAKTWDIVKKMLNPVARGNEALKTSSIIRSELGKTARQKELVYEALKKARKTLDGYSKEEALKVIDGLETGNPPVGFEQFGKIVREALDSRWKQIQDIKGTDAYIENYFPHIWADPEAAKSVLAKSFGKRPFEGTKSYLKQRKIPTIKEGIDLGLTPASYNPVDSVLARVVDMDRFILADKVWNELKTQGLNKFVRVGDERPDNWIKVDDKIATVFYTPTIKEFFDEQVMTKLNALADSLGVKHERVISGKGLGGNRLGVSFTGQNLVKTKFATPEAVLLHEIGHQLDPKFDIQTKFAFGKDIAEMRTTKTGSQVETKESLAHRQKMKSELRALVDLKYENKEVSEYFKNYVRKGEEKVAGMFEAYLHAPDRFQEVAPNVYKAFVDFLKSNPETKPILDIKPSLVYGSNVIPQHILAKAGDWYMPEKAATILNNYLSPGLRGNPIYNAFRLMSNGLNQVQLGLSGFHALFTSGDAVISKAALEIQKIFTEPTLSGKLTSLGKVVSAPVQAPVYLFQNLVRGNALLKDYFRENPQMPDMINALERAGGRVRMDKFYLNDSVENFLKALRGGNYLGAIVRAPGAIIETLGKPIMQELVPRQKLGVFADLAQDIMKQAENEGWDEYKTTLRLQEAWDSVDNRMGQLVYDNLFWNKVVKDLGMASTRSLGWNLGTFREIGGGIKNLAVEPVKGILGKGARMKPNMAYTIALPYIVGIWGAIIFYLYNHKAPEQLLDYYYPRTGKNKPDGTPERISLPSYMKDVFAYKTEPGQTILNKVHPEIAALIDMLQNQDFYGTEIRNTNDSFIKQMGELFAYQAKQFVPFTINNLIQRQKVEGSNWVSYLQSFLGITPAPAYITRTPLQTKIADLYDMRFGGGIKTQAQKDASQAKAEIRTQYMLGNDTKANELLKQAVRNGIIKETGVNQFIREADIPSDVKLFTQLAPADQEALLKNMQLYDLEKYAWSASKEIKAHLGSLSPDAKNFVELVEKGEVKQPKWKRGQMVNQ